MKPICSLSLLVRAVLDMVRVLSGILLMARRVNMRVDGIESVVG